LIILFIGEQIKTLKTRVGELQRLVGAGKEALNYALARNLLSLLALCL
jgi:hypothetical protein